MQYQNFSGTKVFIGIMMSFAQQKTTVLISPFFCVQFISFSRRHWSRKLQKQKSCGKPEWILKLNSGDNARECHTGCSAATAQELQVELQDYKLPSSKASWGDKTEPERKQRVAPGSYNWALSGNLGSCNEFDFKYIHLVSLYNCKSPQNFLFKLN